MIPLASDPLTQYYEKINYCQIISDLKGDYSIVSAK